MCEASAAAHEHAQRLDLRTRAAAGRDDTAALQGKMRIAAPPCPVAAQAAFPGAILWGPCLRTAPGTAFSSLTCRTAIPKSTPMTNALASLSLGDLRRAVALRGRIETLQSQLNRALGGTSGARRAQRSRGTRKRASAKKGGRKMSAAARKRLAAAAKARWKKAKAAGRNSL